MSQQYDHHVPPPPPSPRSGGTSNRAGPVSGSLAPLANAGPVSETLHVPRSWPVAAVLPAITTSNPHGVQSPQASTPVSGNRLSPGIFPYASGTPSGLNPQAPGALPLPPPPPPATPRSPSMEPYNPRQWSRGQLSGSQMVFQQRHSTMPASTAQFTGQEAAMPSPPPPYSPATTDNIARTAAVTVSPMLDNNGFTASPMAESSSRNSPQVPSSPAFPPPPGQSSRYRDRSTSGLGGNKSFFSLSGLRGKQPATIEPYVPQASTSVHRPCREDARPPAAKRAASMGHIQSGSSVATSSTAASTRASPEPNWRPGMPLPGPPPGPPPPGARSQSLNRPLGVVASSSTDLDRGKEASYQRRTLAAVAPSLDPVPPTPANWLDSDTPAPESTETVPQSFPPAGGSTQTEAVSPPLRIHTGASRDTPLARRPARREASTQGLRERRSQSRAAQGTTDEDVRRLSNLVIASPESGSISRRREHMRSASSYAEPSSAPTSSSREVQQESKVPGNVLTPPYTPAPGKQPLYSGKQSQVSANASSDRPVSHLLHNPNETTKGMPVPLSPARPQSSGSAKVSTKLDGFAMQAIERHRAFIENETAAASDEERLELFANFMVHESRLRRDRYTAAYNAMAGDIVDLTRDMWRSYGAGASKRAITPNTAMSSADPTVPSWASDGQPTSANTNIPSSASSTGDFTPATDTSSIGDFGFERTETRQWADSFKPSLSPIPSMAVSTVPDEDSSRGRTASRWWEGSISQGGSVGRPDRIEKTRRETKYMGISPAALHALTPEPNRHSPTPDSDAPAYGYGPDEYPPEKVGWHEETDYDGTPMVTPNRHGDRKPSTPGVEPLDVSRLVTLPPPYPRHHPAVNNSHPLLSDLRNEHRLLADSADIQKIKDAYMDQDYTLTGQQKDAEKRRRAKLRLSIQNKIAEGTISFADAARAEADFDREEAERGKTNSRANFDVFEASVAHPLNSLLTERLAKANTCIKQLRAELESGRDSADPDRAQEEGDEHPERLEKLTLLKWFFEAREQLSKELFDLHTMRSEKYSEVILTPFRLSQDTKKMEEARTFFQKDSIQRQLTFAQESLTRFEELQCLIEKNVSQGVEDQLSAFWDIAPGLLEILQQIPAQMSRVDVHIPLQEYDENPSYHRHPLQYLYSVLDHAEKSAYQFIESQTNLLCLLHEVRTATMKCRFRLVEMERNASGGDEVEVRDEMRVAMREAEDCLTGDLKEKVGEVDRQWLESLGYGLAERKERVLEFLRETGGLEEGFDA